MALGLLDKIATASAPAEGESVHAKSSPGLRWSRAAAWSSAWSAVRVLPYHVSAGQGPVTRKGGKALDRLTVVDRGLLGMTESMTEVPKPTELARRGGAWFG